MALLHSRIGRVFYRKPTKTGALGTVYKIHSHRSLNHHVMTCEKSQDEAENSYLTLSVDVDNDEIDA
jgi:tRNA(Arg) A34 adenosine deaminase TadA